MTLRELARDLVARGLLSVPSSLTGVSILMYHSVAPHVGGFITDTPDDFEREMRYIAERGFRTVFSSELPALMRSGNVSNTVCITLDDGYEDNYKNAFPVLRRYHLKATVFLITGLLGASYTDSHGVTRRLLSEDQIKSMLESGLVEFMPHSHAHRDMPVLDDRSLEREIALSKDAITRITGSVPNIFAYPKGKHDDRVVHALAMQEFEAALTVRPGIARTGGDLYRLPRNPMGRISDAELSLKLSDRLDTYLAMKRLL